MGWFKQLGFNKCFYLSYFFIIYFLLFGLFIFGYGELGLLNQGVHNFYLRVFTVLFKVYNIYIKKIYPLILKSQGVQLHTLT